MQKTTLQNMVSILVKPLRLCFGWGLLFFPMLLWAQAQPQLEQCGDYSVLRLQNTSAASQTIPVFVNGTLIEPVLQANEVRNLKLKADQVKVAGRDVIAKMSNAALCFSSQLDTRYFSTKPSSQNLLGGDRGYGVLADPFCGNGAKEGTEECDDGNTNNCDTCKNNCISQSIPVCGNQQITSGCEQCDDGNTTNGDGCSSTCRYEQTCGNGAIEGTEQCDDGNTNSCDGCSTFCLSESIPVCGNGSIQQCTETCDDGNTNSGDGCSATCQKECGNGTLNGTEQCDDGNTSNGDGCDNQCFSEVCGNGFIQTGETCDDGNTSNGDGCSSTCIKECGNGSINGTEQCDDGNIQSGDGCDHLCRTEACGNGRIDATYVAPYYIFEQCDDGNTNDNDSCSNSCTFAPDMTLTKRAFFSSPTYSASTSTYYQSAITNYTALLPNTLITYHLAVNFGKIGNSGITGQTFTVSDVLPAGVTYVSHKTFNSSNSSGTTSGGTYDPITGIWQVASPINYATTVYLEITAILTATSTNCAQVTAYSRADFDSTPNNMAGNVPMEDDEACITLNILANCSNNALTSGGGFEAASGGVTTTYYDNTEAKHYPNTNMNIEASIRTAYNTSSLTDPNGVTLINSMGDPFLGDPFSGNKYIRLLGAGQCIATTVSGAGGKILCAAISSEYTAATFKMEATAASGALITANNYVAPAAGGWLDLNWNTYCINLPFNADRGLITTTLDFDPLLIDNLCLMNPVVQCTNPTTTASAQDVSCYGGVARNDGQIILNGFSQLNQFSLWKGTTASPPLATIDEIPLNGIIKADLSNPTSASENYIVRIFNGTCFVDRTVTLNQVDCTCVPATAELTATSATCSGAVANSDASLTLSGFAPSDRYAYTVGTSYGGSAIYETATSIPVNGIIVNNLSNPTGAQAYTVRIFHENGCHTDKTVYLIGSVCQSSCSINPFTISPVCNNNGTNNTATDDYRTFSINASGSGTASSYTVSVNNGGSVVPTSGTFATASNFQLQSGSAGNGTTYTLTLTDATNSTCTQTATITDPGSCSTPTPSCSLNSPTTSSTCNDNGTPSNPNDDVFSYNITVTGTNTGTAYDISGGDTRSGLAYNTQQGAFGTFPISGGNLSLTVSDATNAGCTTSTTVQAPAACSNQVACTMNDPVVVAYCNTNGTPSGADDTFGYTINASGTGVSTLYDVMGDDIRNDLPYNTVNGPYGWYPLSQGALVLNVIDNVDTGCSAAAVVIAPDDCTTCTDPSGICVYVPPAGTCTITAPNVTGVCNDNGTPSNPADDTFTYQVNVTGTDVGVSNQYNISGGDTRTGLTYGLNQGPFGSFLISGGNLSLTATDVDIPTCMDAFTVTAPASCSNTTPQADLRVVKTASSTTVSSGQSVTYTITVTNDGPSTATNIQIRDVISTMLTYVSNTPSVGSYNVGTGIWAIPTLANGANATLQITVTVN